MIIKVTKTIYTKWNYYAMDITGIFYERDICNNGMLFSLILLITFNAQHDDNN